MQKRKTANLTLVVLVLVILSLIGVSGTYAKYTTTVSGKGNAVVAQWDFKAADKNGNELSENFEVNIADYLETGVVEADGVKKIQPGSKGTLPITVTNNGDVAAKLTVEVDESATAKFTKNQFTFTQPAADSTVAAGATVTVNVPFEWKYDVSGEADTEDTTIGEEATAEALELVTIKVTGTQVAPQ